MKIISLLLFAVILLACSSKEKELEQQNAEVARSMFEAFNRHDWKAMAEQYADSALFLDPSLGNEYVSQNHEQIISKYAEMEKMFPDIHDEMAGIYTSGDKVIVEFVSTGMATPATGGQMSLRLPICSVLTIRGGKIVKDNITEGVFCATAHLSVWRTHKNSELCLTVHLRCFLEYRV